MKFKIWKTALALAALLTLLAFPGPAPAANGREMTVIYASYLDFLMDLPIALELGYFKEEGLDLEALDIQSSPTRNSMLPTNRVDGSFLPSETALTMADKGFYMVMVCGIGNRSFDFAVLADSPIKSIKDFQGKTIANVPKPSNPVLALNIDMAAAGVTANVITTKTAADRLAMLVSKQVDVIMSNPATEARLGDDIRIAHSCSTSKYLWNSCGWCFKPEYLEKNPESVRKFVKGLSRARELIVNDRAKAIAVYSKYNKLQDDSYKKPFALCRFDNPPVIYIYGLEKTYEMKRAEGELKNEIDLSRLVDDRFAKALSDPY